MLSWAHPNFIFSSVDDKVYRRARNTPARTECEQTNDNENPLHVFFSKYDMDEDLAEEIASLIIKNDPTCRPNTL